jgi:hypothetical protein
MKKIIVILIVLSINSCSNNKPAVFEIQHFKDTTFRFESQTSSPTCVEIYIKGYSNDSFMINSLLLPPGNYNDTLKPDWYNDTVYVHFKPYKATQGHLVLSCRTPGGIF